MNTKKIKTAIIVMLIIANVFFLSNLYMLNDRTSKIPQQMIEDAVNILRQGGLNVSKEIIPVKKPQKYIYEGVYSPEVFAEIARSLSEAEITKTFSLPWGGMSYNAGEYKFDFGGFGESPDYFLINITTAAEESSYPDPIEPFDPLDDYEVQSDYEEYKDYEEYADYEDIETRVNNLVSAGLKDYKKIDIAKAEDVIKSFLKRYQPYSETADFETLGFQKNAGSEYIVIKQILDGLAFSSHVVFAEIKDEKVFSFTGKWYFGAFVGKYTMPLLDSVNILFKCLEKDGSVIQDAEKLSSMDLYYSIVWHEVNKFYLIPLWRLNFDSGRELSYNTVTGDKPTNN